MIAIIDYGAGNLASVQKALTKLGYENTVTNSEKILLKSDGVILPGVGSFGDAMSNLRKLNLDKTISKIVNNNIPLMGICLGLQLLFECSQESPEVSGLGILQGSILKIPKNKELKIPQIGWNNIKIAPSSSLFRGVNNNSYVYFVHSYYLDATDKNIVSATVEYGVTLDIAIESKNIYATQFHPEKSGDIGLKILDNFCKICLKECDIC